MLEIKNLHKNFGGIKAVDGCSFKIEKGTIVGLIGPNGAGKTTVFNLVSNFLKTEKGKITFGKEDCTDISPNEIFNLGISRTFQDIRLFPKMTVLENMMTAMKDQNENFWYGLLMLPHMKRQEKENEKKALEWLKFVDLHAKKDELASDLSYGQQKLLEIARALASDPELLMLDEPASGVNLTMLNKIKNVIIKLKEKGKTVLMIEHNMDFVMNICDKIVVLDHGKEIAVGKPEKIRKNKKVLDAYLGR